PSVEIIIDLHRDAAAYSGGTGKTFSTEGKTGAQFSLVVGIGNGNASQLMSFAQEVMDTAEALYPGFPDRIIEKDYKYNQYVGDRCLLLEMGNNENDIEEVKVSARCFARVLEELLE
ncbi:MAG: stage II sporulation protein P, partial [Bacillota bacterium]|nr:stage II sporulation protein P [Bacillota bacterium]